MNCPKHIPRKLDEAPVRAQMERLEARVRALEAENAGLRAAALHQETPS